MIREPVVNGQFYPAQKAKLESQIETFQPRAVSPIVAKGIILPHAGYIYSGRVAVTTVSNVKPKQRLVLLGPNHTGLGADFSLWNKGSWKTPLGNIDIDEDLAEQILAKGNYISVDYHAHESEHSLEVQLPILYYFFGKFSFVPIVCKIAVLEIYQKVANQIIEASKHLQNEILFVASTDLTHYELEATARKKDRLVIETIINLDEESLVKTVARNNITMCGVAPVAILISCLKKLGARKSQVILYQTSGDVSGDYSSVVGYVGMVIK